MNILLTHGYFIHDDPVESGIMKPYPPIGLLYISAWLKRSGIAHDIFDSTFSGLAELKAHLEKTKIDLIGIYATLMTRSNALDIMAFMRKNPELQDAVIVIGGPDARYNAEGYLSAGADVVVPGEGEETLEEIIQAVSAGQKNRMNEVKGIFYRDDAGSVIYSRERKLLDLNKIPPPSYDKIDVHSYLRTWKNKHGFSSLTINSMRGCPYSCNWCSKSVFGNTYRRRSPRAVVEEMTWLGSNFQPDQVWFTDDVFTINKSWIKEFTDEVVKQKVSLPYECITRSDCLDEEILGMLKRSGCRKVWIGAESGSQKVIDLMNRKIDLKWTAEMMIRLKSLKISAGTFIMLGYHGEKKKDIFQTASFLKKTLPDDLTIGVAYPIKGTKYFEIIEPFFDHPYDWKLGNERQIRFKKPYSDRFYRFSCRYLFNIVMFNTEIRPLKRFIHLSKAIFSKIYMLCFN